MKPVAVMGDVFAGLFTLGVQHAGFDVIASLEHCKYGNKTAKLNFPDLEFRIGTETWYPLPNHERGISAVFTNPPCAPWSAAGSDGHKNKHKSDPRVAWIPELRSATIDMDADAFVWESVTNAWRHGRDFMLSESIAWMDAGYNVTILLQNNIYLGTPQKRKRVMLVAHRNPLVWPEFTMPVSVGEALADLDITDEEKAEVELQPWAKMLHSKSHDIGIHNLRRVWVSLDDDEKEELKRRPTVLMQRFRSEHPAPVYLGLDKAVHDTEPRYFTMKEAKTLCGVPLDFQTHGSLGSATHELSRAVHPPVGKWIATAIKNGLNLPPLTDRKTVLVDAMNPHAKGLHEEVLLECQGSV